MKILIKYQTKWFDIFILTSSLRNSFHISIAFFFFLFHSFLPTTNLVGHYSNTLTSSINLKKKHGADICVSGWLLSGSGFLYCEHCTIHLTHLAINPLPFLLEIKLSNSINIYFPVALRFAAFTSIIIFHKLKIIILPSIYTILFFAFLSLYCIEQHLDHRKKRKKFIVNCIPILSFYCQNQW